MKAPLSWLQQYVDIKVTPKEFADAMTLSGSKVEAVEVMGEEIQKVVIGKILTRDKHPDADKLQLCMVDVGEETIQIVTGAKNIEVGNCIPVALHGSLLPGGKKITKGKLRGIESNGMMCSIQELELSKEEYPDAAEDGIFILPEDAPVGTDIKKYLGLNETVIEFEITSNRPDCFSMLGLAREAAVTLDEPLKKPEIRVNETEEEAAGQAVVEIEAPDLCARYAARIVKDVKIGPSPAWMRHRLSAAGVRPINNIVDITNYVMLELGQPMHAFDLHNIQGNKIIVRRAKDGEIMHTLDDQERKLDSSMLVIADAQRPVAVAGVMGGANSEVTEETRTILFESAHFNGSSVRFTAKKLGMRTEASSRFEKGLDVENIITAVDRAVQLVEELGAGKVCRGVIDNYPKKPEAVMIPFRPAKINAFLGTDVPVEEMKKIFAALELKLDETQQIVQVPTFRPDLEREADLAEEVARFYGYNKIHATLLSGKSATMGIRTPKQKIESILRNTMVACGMHECYTYSFTSPKVFDKINLPADSVLRKTVVISNPLGEDYSIMRTTTLPDMLEVISTNYNRRIEQARLFELSHIYLPDPAGKQTLPEEREVLTLGMYGSYDFYDLKGVVEEIFKVLGIEKYELEPEKENPSYHPGRAAKILLNGTVIGILGEIHPEVAENFEAPERTYIACIEVALLVDSAVSIKSYKSLPRYPAVTRDIAMLVADSVMVKQIEAVISQRAGKILESITLFDVYKGKQIPEGMKSVAYSITFRAEDRTLTDEDVNKAMGKILDGLKTNLDAQLRE